MLQEVVYLQHMCLSKLSSWMGSFKEWRFMYQYWFRSRLCIAKGTELPKLVSLIEHEIHSRTEY